MGFQLGSRGWTDQGRYRFGGWRKTRLGQSGGHQFSGTEFFQAARNSGDERQYQVDPIEFSDGGHVHRDDVGGRERGWPSGDG